MSVHALQGRIDRMLAALDRQMRPRLIDCTGAREQLLARLQQHSAASAGEDPDGEPVTLPEWCTEFHAALEQSVKDIERCYNVKFVSEDQAA